MGVGAGWYYDSLDGMVVHQNLPESLANVAFSYYHGPYATEALAMAHKGVSGPASSTNESLGTQVGNAAGSVGGITGLSGLISAVSSPNFWTRAGEFVVGLILLDIGLKAFTGHSVIETAGKTAAKGAVLAA